MRLNVAQFLLPLAGEFSTFEEILLDDTYEGNACGRGFQTLANFLNILPLVECLDDGGTRRGTADAVGFEGVAQLVVVHHLAGRLHGAEEGGFGVGFGRCGLLLGEGRLMWAMFALLEGGKGLLFVGIIRIFRIFGGF